MAPASWKYKTNENSKLTKNDFLQTNFAVISINREIIQVVIHYITKYHELGAIWKFQK